MNSNVFAIQNLRHLCQEYSLAISEQQGQLFGIYLDELWAWNRHMNLIGLSSPEKMITELLLDSLIPAPFLPHAGRLLDIGSGAGFPALPLKIYYPLYEIHLLEPNQKKVSFLKHAIRLLKLSGAEVIRGRVEEWGSKLETGKYTVITSRALADLDQTLTWCGPLLKPGNRLVCFLGREGLDLLEKKGALLNDLQLEIEKSILYLLPGRAGRRYSIIFIKF